MLITSIKVLSKFLDSYHSFYTKPSNNWIWKHYLNHLNMDGNPTDASHVPHLVYPLLLLSLNLLALKRRATHTTSLKQLPRCQVPIIMSTSVINCCLAFFEQRLTENPHCKLQHAWIVNILKTLWCILDWKMSEEKNLLSICFNTLQNGQAHNDQAFDHA